MDNERRYGPQDRLVVPVILVALATSATIVFVLAVLR